MKIRNGFVSNSSSSGNGIQSLYVEYSSYDYVTGIVIADDECLEESITSFAELQEMAQKVSDALKVDISEVKLITGTRPC